MSIKCLFVVETSLVFFFVSWVLILLKQMCVLKTFTYTINRWNRYIMNASFVVLIMTNIGSFNILEKLCSKCSLKVNEISVLHIFFTKFVVD